MSKSSSISLGYAKLCILSITLLSELLSNFSFTLDTLNRRLEVDLAYGFSRLALSCHFFSFPSSGFAATI